MVLAISNAICEDNNLGKAIWGISVNRFKTSQHKPRKYAPFITCAARVAPALRFNVQYMYLRAFCDAEKFDYPGAVLGATRSNMSILRGRATTECTGESDLPVSRCFGEQFPSYEHTTYFTRTSTNLIQLRITPQTTD